MFSRITTVAVAATLVLSGQARGPRFYPDDPIQVDDDRAFDASKAEEAENSEGWDFIDNTFRAKGRVEDIRALNVNTLDEVPDSSWFTNRIGRRPMTLAEIEKGPDTIENFSVTDWVVVGGKGPGGMQPGFRAIDARDKRPAGEYQMYQLEGDLSRLRELATGAEMAGTFAYHALGYNVVDTYLVNVDPKRVTIGPGITIRDESGRREFRQADLDDIFRSLAKNPDGTYRMTASRYVQGKALEAFRYHGTRPDDPNDIYPHQHRRELRGNRVFAAWLNHDDSRSINSLDMLVGEKGRQWIRHYMFDFGSLFGSTPRRWSGFEYMYDPDTTVRQLLTLGLWVPPWYHVNYPPDMPVSAQRFESDGFEPQGWKPEYPNPAFLNMRPDDAFWAAKILAAFSNQAIAAIVRKAQYTEARATEHLTRVLIERRDKAVRVWINGVNPLTDFALSPQGVLTFENASERARASTPGASYVLSWSRFNNDTDTHQVVGIESAVRERRAQMPAELGNAQYVAVTLRSIHPDHPAWNAPVRAYFRKEGAGWKTVGIDRP